MNVVTSSAALRFGESKTKVPPFRERSVNDQMYYYSHLLVDTVCLMFLSLIPPLWLLPNPEVDPVISTIVVSVLAIAGFIANWDSKCRHWEHLENMAELDALGHEVKRLRNLQRYSKGGPSSLSQVSC